MFKSVYAIALLAGALSLASAANASSVSEREYKRG